MSEQVIIYPEANNAVSVVIPFPGYLVDHTIEDVAKKDVPKGLPYRIVNRAELPQHIVFRGAWEYEPLQINPDKAKIIAHGIRRQKRSEEFAPLDDLISKKIPNVNEGEIERQRQQIREKYDAIQSDIDACSDIESLVQIVKKLGRNV